MHRGGRVTTDAILRGGDQKLPGVTDSPHCPQGQGRPIPGRGPWSRHRRDPVARRTPPPRNPPPPALRLCERRGSWASSSAPPTRPLPSRSRTAPPSPAARCPGGRKDSRTRLLHNSDPVGSVAGGVTWRPRQPRHVASVTLARGTHSSSPSGTRAEARGRRAEGGARGELRPRRVLCQDDRGRLSPGEKGLCRHTGPWPFQSTKSKFALREEDGDLTATFPPSGARAPRTRGNAGPPCI